MRGLSIIIPAYNEAAGIAQVLNQLREVQSDLSEMLESEVIVVDDGSSDDTGVIVSSFDFVILIQHPRNRGYGAALKTGLQRARYDMICIIDADSTYPNEAIATLVQTYIDGNLDMVVGARLGKKAQIPLIRRPAKWAITQLAKYLTETNIPDLNSGLRIMKKDVVERFIRILPDGFSFTSTITLAMLTNGYSLEYVPIEYFKRVGKSKIRPIHDTLNFVQLIVRTVLYFDPLKVFLPISLPLVGGGVILMFIQAFFYQNISTVSVIITLGGIQLLAIGMLADLIDKRTG